MINLATKKLPKKIILWHTAALPGLAFDLIIHKDATSELTEEEKLFIQNLPKVDCEYVKEFLNKFPDYQCLGSGYLLHSCGLLNYFYIFKITELKCKYNWEYVFFGFIQEFFKPQQSMN